MRALVVLGSVLAVTASAMAGDLVITEVQANSLHGAGSANGDWWELTNTGLSLINLNGYQWIDNGGGFNNDNATFGNVSIAAGESIIICEEDTSTINGWRSAWNVAASVQVLARDTFTGPNIFSGLSSGGDAVQLFDNFGSLVTSVFFGASAGTGATHEYSTDGSSMGFSVAGQFGAYQALNNGGGGGPLDAAGSPGSAVPAPGVLALLAAGLFRTSRRRSA